MYKSLIEFLDCVQFCIETFSKLKSINLFDKHKKIAWLFCLSCTGPDEVKSLLNILSKHTNVLEQYLLRLYKSEVTIGQNSDIINIGIHAASFFSSDELQKSLDIKRLSKKKDDSSLAFNIDISTCQYSQDKVVIRIVALTDTFEIDFPDTVIIKQNHPKYFDIILTSRNNNTLLSLLELLNSNSDVKRIVYISNLRFVKANFSNEQAFALILAFIFCQHTNLVDITYNSKYSTNLLLFQIKTFSFLYTDNLNNISSDTLALTQLSTESVNSKIKRCLNDKDKFLIGTRDFANLNFPMNSGVFSSSEVVFKLNLKSEKSLFTVNEW